jgi:phenylalanyl-tRNA synthetase beta chain
MYVCFHTILWDRTKRDASIEPVKVTMPDGQSRITPDISERSMLAHTSYVNTCTGLSLKTDEVSKLLSKMCLFPTPSSTNADEIQVNIPATRPDIFHECDIMEDAAIAYGFNNLPHTFPATTTVGQPSAIMKLSDIIRLEWALAGWVEVLPLTLVRIVTARCRIQSDCYPFSVHTKKTLPG